MTRRQSVLLLIGASCLGVLAVGVQWTRASVSAQRLSERTSLHRSLLDDAETTAQAHARMDALAPDAVEPEQETAGLIQRVLNDAGLGESSLRSISERTRTARATVSDGGARVIEEGFQLTLAQIEPQMLGAFLDAWYRADSRWTPTRIELRRVNTTRADEPFDAVLVLSAQVLERSP